MSRLSKNAGKFARKVDLYRNCCARIEKQFEEKRLSITDVELVYASSFLSVCSQWESMLEETIFEVVCGEASERARRLRLAAFSSRKQFERVLLHPNKKYLGISNVKEAQKITSLFVRDGIPFTAIDDASMTYLQQAVSIRNAIAHQGDHAVKLFRDSVPGVDQLRPAKRFPGAFLRHIFRQSPSQRRYELYFAAYKRSARLIADAW